MFKTGIKSYFKNLPNFFIVLGVVFLFILIGLCIFIPSTISLVKTAGNELTSTFKELPNDIDVEKSVEAISKKIQEVDWTNVTQALSSIFNWDYFLEICKTCIVLKGESEIPASAWKEKIEPGLKGTFNNFTTGLIASFLVLIFLILLSIIVSIIVAKLNADLDFKKVKPFRYFAALIIDSLILTILWIVYFIFLFKSTAALYTIWVLSFFIMIAVYLLQSFWVYGKGKIKFKEIFNIKPILQIMGATAIGYFLALIVIVLTYKYFNNFLGLVIAAPLYTTIYLICDYTTKRYIVKLCEDKENEKKFNIRDFSNDVLGFKC